MPYRKKNKKSRKKRREKKLKHARIKLQQNIPNPDKVTCRNIKLVCDNSEDSKKEIFFPMAVLKCIKKSDECLPLKSEIAEEMKCPDSVKCDNLVEEDEVVALDTCKDYDSETKQSVQEVITEYNQPTVDIVLSEKKAKKLSPLHIGTFSEQCVDYSMVHDNAIQALSLIQEIIPENSPEPFEENPNIFTEDNILSPQNKNMNYETLGIVNSQHKCSDNIVTEPHDPLKERTVVPSNQTHVIHLQMCEELSEEKLNSHQKFSCDSFNKDTRSISRVVTDLNDLGKVNNENNNFNVQQVFRTENINWPFLLTLSFILAILKWLADQSLISLRRLRSLLGLQTIETEVKHCACCHQQGESQVLRRLEMVEKELEELKKAMSNMTVEIANKSKEKMQCPVPPPLPPPPTLPPPPPPPMPLFSQSTPVVLSKGKKEKQKSDGSSVRPSITVEDLRKVQLRKTPASSRVEKNVGTPNGPVVSLEMLQSVKLRSCVQRRKSWDRKRAGREDNLKVKSPSNSPRENPFTWVLRKKESAVRLRGKSVISTSLGNQFKEALFSEV